MTRQIVSMERRTSHCLSFRGPLLILLAFACCGAIFSSTTVAAAAPTGQVSVQQTAPGNGTEDVLRLAWKAGQQLCEEGRFTKAAAYLRQYVKERPRSADGWYWLGKAQEGAGDLEKAQDAYRRALEVDPEYPALSRILAAHEDGNALPLWDPAQSPLNAQPASPQGPAYYISPQPHAVEFLVPQGTAVQAPFPQTLPMAPVPGQNAAASIMPLQQGTIVPSGGIPRIELPAEPLVTPPAGQTPQTFFSPPSTQSQPLLPGLTPLPNPPQGQAESVPATSAPSPAKPSPAVRNLLSPPVVVKPATPPTTTAQSKKSAPSGKVPVYVPPTPEPSSATPMPSFPRRDIESTPPPTATGEQGASASPAPVYIPPVPTGTIPIDPRSEETPPVPTPPGLSSETHLFPESTSMVAPELLSGDTSQDVGMPSSSGN